MEIRNNNPLDLAGAAGEEITVRTTAKGTAFSVAYAVNDEGDALPPLFRFKLRKPPTTQKAVLLVMTCIFSNPGGGMYHFVVSGSQGSQTANYTVTQFEDEPKNTFAFSFDVK
ncbi:MAG TPA: hypothetical protein VJ842_06240 [Pyrinomonadaceae bacterium]|nr:hypothetical protein [Pyrinomonadaceae bacterium]